MASQNRDEKGRFNAKMHDQDVLKAFDYETTAEDPYLTVKEVTAALAEHFDIDVTTEAVRVRLETLQADDMVAKRQFGAGVAYRALVGPRLSKAATATSDERRQTPHDEFVTLNGK